MTVKTASNLLRKGPTGGGKRGNPLLFFFFFFLALSVTAGAEENRERDLADCSRFFETLEQTIRDAGVSDASAFPLPNAPYLRSTRFLEEMRLFVTNREEHEEWLNLLYQRGLETVGKEIENLPSGILSDGPSLLPAQVRKCGNRLIAAAKEDRRFTNLLSPAARIPSEYRRARKILGLYPLMTLPIGTAIAFYQHKMKKRYRIPLARLPARGKLVTYAPGSAEAPGTDRTTPAEILAKSSRNPLGIPLPKRAELFRLVTHFAPLLV